MLRTPRGAVLGALLTAALAVGLLQAPGQAASAHPRPTGTRLGRRTRTATCPPRSGSPTCSRQDDAGGEGRPDDPGRARRRRRRPVADHDVRPGQRAVGRRVDPGREHARGVGRHGRQLPGGGARDPARASRCCTAWTPCTATATCWAPPSSRTTSASAPPATRRWSRRSSTSPRWRPGRPARSGRSRRASAWPATTAGAAPTRASGRPDAGRAWRPRSTASRATAGSRPAKPTACWPPPSTSPATA